MLAKPGQSKSYACYEHNTVYSYVLSEIRCLILVAKLTNFMVNVNHEFKQEENICNLNLHIYMKSLIFLTA